MLATAVIFDLDCTLTDRDRSIMAFAERFAEAYALHLLVGVTTDAIAIVIRAADGFGYESRVSVCESLQQKLTWRTPPAVGHLLSFWTSVFPNCTVARDGFGDLLTALRQASIRIGLISNGKGRTQRRKLRAINANDVFDSVLISEEVGLRKPDRSIFELSLRQLGTFAANAWYVGDHPLYDIDGARAAGLRAVWMEGVHAWPPMLAKPAITIRDLRELIPLVIPKER